MLHKFRMALAVTIVAMAGRQPAAYQETASERFRAPLVATFPIAHRPQLWRTQKPQAVDRHLLIAAFCINPCADILGNSYRPSLSSS